MTRTATQAQVGIDAQIEPTARPRRATYAEHREAVLRRYPRGITASGLSVEDIVQLRIQNTYATHLEIARDMARVIRADMAEYDRDASRFTQSLGCWSGFHAQQMIKSVKRLRGTTKGAYVYLSGWMVAGLRNTWGHLPDQSMHEKTAVVELIREIYVSLRQADEVALNDLFRNLTLAREHADATGEAAAIRAIDRFESHVVPIIADIDAGFGNEHATYLLAKEMIKAGASCLQIVDLFFSYDFKSEGALKDVSLTLNLNNVFDADPPFYNQDNGFTNGTTLGRFAQIGLTKRF